MNQHTIWKWGALLVLLAIPSLAIAEDRGPPQSPGFHWTVHDDQGWTGEWERVGTDLTLAELETVPFFADFSKKGQASVTTEIEMFIGKRGDIHVTRTDPPELAGGRQCTYQGMMWPGPANSPDQYFERRHRIMGGIYICSDMSKTGFWVAKGQW